MLAAEMAAGVTKIFNLVQTKSLVAGINGGSVSPPRMTQGDTFAVEFTLLEDPTNGGFQASPQFTRIAPGGYSLKIGVFTAAGDQLFYQNAFTADATNLRYTGSLVPNSVNIATALVGKTETDCVFEIEITDLAGNVITTFSGATTLRKEFITTAAVTVPPGETALTLAAGNNLYVPRVHSQFTPQEMLSPSGLKFLFYMGDDGQPHFDPIP